jgi:hypothetical protein
MTPSQLLRAAAEALDDQRDPLTEPFLTDNGVTYDQMLGLAEQLSIGARIVAYGLDHPQSAAGSVLFEAMVRSL